MNKSVEHEWIDVGFIHDKLVCKHCDVEKEKCIYWRCSALEKKQWETDSLQWMGEATWRDGGIL